MSEPGTSVSHPRLAPRRASARSTTWWGKAWVRAVEESAYSDRELTRARSLARDGRVGSITVGSGAYVASVEDASGLWGVSGSVPVLDPDLAEAFVEVVAAESGRVAALLSGDLPHRVVEDAEEAGVELLPFGGELGSACTCAGWVDPCVHALAVAYQLAWLIDADPFVLLLLRGLAREELLARLHARDDHTEELDVGLEAALRAARVLEALERDAAPAEHLF